jgi:hypothetical protein
MYAYSKTKKKGNDINDKKRKYTRPADRAKANEQRAAMLSLEYI